MVFQVSLGKYCCKTIFLDLSNIISGLCSNVSGRLLWPLIFRELKKLWTRLPLRVLGQREGLAHLVMTSAIFTGPGIHHQSSKFVLLWILSTRFQGLVTITLTLYGAQNGLTVDKMKPLLDINSDVSLEIVSCSIHLCFDRITFVVEMGELGFGLDQSHDTIAAAPTKEKLLQLNVPDSNCRWITDFLIDRRQCVRLGKNVSTTQCISTGTPQGCVLSPLLFSLYTNCCTSSHDSVKLIKFADDTTLIGLICNDDESAYRREVDRLGSWCSINNLELNTQKTVEMIVDFRKVTAPSPPLTLSDSPITLVDSVRFLGTTITQDLKWEPSICSLLKKAQQRMYFLRQLKKARLPAQMMVQFYTAIIESILTSSITVWYTSATTRDINRLQRIVRSAEKVIGCSLPSVQELYVSRTRGRAGRIAADPSHPGHYLLKLLPSGRRLRSIRTRTSRHKNSFFPSAVRLLRPVHTGTNFAGDFRRRLTPRD
ncbi:uncharacterized protein LOC144992077 isoform X1 [Oryzias latipes]